MNRKGTEQMQIAYRHPLDQAGWTIAYHRITLDRRIPDGALRLYLLLHRYAQQHGETWTSVERLAQDLGVTEKTIQRHLRVLTQVGLIERKREGFGATFTTYILDPRGRYSEILQESGCIPDKNVQYDCAIPDKNVRSYRTKMSAHEEIKIEEIKEEEEKGTEKAEKTERAAEIAQTLKENGVFSAAAEEIAWEMAHAGLTAEDALDILLGTIRSIQSGMCRGDEEIMGLAVGRLRRGIWDAGGRVRDAIRRAQRQPTDDQEDYLERLSETQGSDLWQAALGQLQLEMTRATFETLLRGSRLVACEDGVFVIGVTNTYARDWLDSRLRPVITRVLNRLTGREVSVRFEVL